MRHNPSTNRCSGWAVTVFLLIASLIISACGSSAAGNAPTVTVTPSFSPTATTSATPFQFTSPTWTNTPTVTASPTHRPTATRTPFPTATDNRLSHSAGKVMVPILLYHHISDKGSSRYFIHIADFRAQMKALSEAGYQTVSISQVADIIRDGGRLPPKPVVLTFDDGYLDTYENALPILKEFGFTGVAYIITDTLGTNLSYGYMQVDELKALVAAGWEIGSHSVTHSDLKTTRLGMGVEMSKSKKDLETLLGIQVRSFSYPYGSANPWIQEHVKDYGYDSAVGLDVVVTQTTKRLFYLSRREVYHGATLKDFIALLTPSKDELIMLQAEETTPIP